MAQLRIYGLNASLACVQKRRDQILRAFFVQNTAAKFSALMKYMATQKKVYRIVTDEEMEKISQSQHHEGVCLILEQEEILSAEGWLALSKKEGQLVILENVGNPHNMGAILRICAHFGIATVAVSNAKVARSGAALRVAEGGGEYVEVIEFQNLEGFVKKLKKLNYKIYATSSHNGKSLYEITITKPFAILFGEEARGLTKGAMDLADHCLQIPGSGNVESLNVATALSVILGEAHRQHQEDKK